MQLEFNFFIFLACKWDIVPLKQLKTRQMLLRDLTSIESLCFNISLQLCNVVNTINNFNRDNDTPPWHSSRFQPSEGPSQRPADWLSTCVRRPIGLVHYCSNYWSNYWRLDPPVEYKTCLLTLDFITWRSVAAAHETSWSSRSLVDHT